MEIDLGVVSGADDKRDEIPGGDVLLSFAEAVVSGDPARIAGASHRLADALGDAAVVDAAAVIAAFSMNDRIADATGIPLDDAGRDVRESIASNLGVRRYDEGTGRLEGPGEEA